MDIFLWIVIIALFVIGFVGLVYPIIPSVLFIAGGILLYGVFFTFEDFSILFWIVQIIFVIMLFLADYASNLIGVKRFGGSKAGIWGSTIGLLIGPFVIPVAGIIIGPFIGAVVAELIVNRTSFSNSMKIGFGSVVGFIAGAVSKFIIQAFMVAYFFFSVL